MSAGHRLPEIRDYTLAQVRAFTAAIHRQRRGQMRDAALVARVAQAERQPFREFLRGLDGAD